MRILLNLCLFAMAMTSISCLSVWDRTIRVEKDASSGKTEIHANTTLVSMFDPDGFSREYNLRANIRIFGKGSSMAVHGLPGKVFMYGKDFYVDGVPYVMGYLWVSDDRHKISIALFEADPPTGVRASKFNKIYTFPEEVPF